MVLSYRCRCRLSWGSPGIRNIFCPSVGLLRISILLRWCPCCASMLLFWHPLLSNGFVATESRRVSCSLSDPLVHGNKGPWKLGIWLWSFFLLFLHQVKDKRRKNRRSTPAASASNIHGTGRFWISVPTRTTRCWPFRDLCDLIPRWTSKSFLVLSDLQELILCVNHISWISHYFFDFPIRSTSFKITSCAIPSILRSTLDSDSFSTVDSFLTCNFLERDDSRSFVELPWSCLCSLGTLCIQFPGAGRHITREWLLLLLLRLPSTCEYKLRCGTRRREFLQIKFGLLIQKSLW